MLINIKSESIIKSLFICHVDSDTGISFMIPIQSDTFDIVYNPNVCTISPDNQLVQTRNSCQVTISNLTIKTLTSTI